MRVGCVTAQAEMRTSGDSSVPTFAGIFEKLKVGSEYIVYGMMLIHGELSYLILYDGNLPLWLPASLFEIRDSRLVSNWYFKTNSNGQVPCSIWGYRELALDQAHVDALARSGAAMRIFRQRKNEIERDLFYSLLSVRGRIIADSPTGEVADERALPLSDLSAAIEALTATEISISEAQVVLMAGAKFIREQYWECTRNPEESSRDYAVRSHKEFLDFIKDIPGPTTNKFVTLSIKEPEW